LQDFDETGGEKTSHCSLIAHALLLVREVSECRWTWMGVVYRYTGCDNEGLHSGSVAIWTFQPLESRCLINSLIYVLWSFLLFTFGFAYNYLVSYVPPSNRRHIALLCFQPIVNNWVCPFSVSRDELYWNLTKSHPTYLLVWCVCAPWVGFAVFSKSQPLHRTDTGLLPSRSSGWTSTNIIGLPNEQNTVLASRYYNNPSLCCECVGINTSNTLLILQETNLLSNNHHTTIPDTHLNHRHTHLDGPT